MGQGAKSSAHSRTLSVGCTPICVHVFQTKARHLKLEMSKRLKTPKKAENLFKQYSHTQSEPQPMFLALYPRYQDMSSRNGKTSVAATGSSSRLHAATLLLSCAEPGSVIAELSTLLYGLGCRILESDQVSVLIFERPAHKTACNR